MEDLFVQFFNQLDAETQHLLLFLLMMRMFLRYPEKPQPPPATAGRKKS